MAPGAPESTSRKRPISNPRSGYIPSVSRAGSSVKTAAEEMIAAGMLAPDTNVEELARRAFAHLDGVTDKWTEKTEVRRVAGGEALPTLAEARKASSDPSTANAPSSCAMPISDEAALAMAGEPWRR